MVRIVGGSVALLVLIVAAYACSIYSDIHDLEVVRVTDDLHMVTAGRLGGNVGILATELGAVVVDTMTFRSQAKQILGFAERYGRGPVQAIINTHYHLDHTHGNPAFARGSRVVATRRTLDYLRHFDAAYWEGEVAQTLPNHTFEDSYELSIGGKTIRCLYLGSGHTGGDLVVHFVEDGVVHTGDLFVHRLYPNIDLEAGGSLRAWIETLDRLLALDFERLIPGHGALAGRAELEAFQGFLRELWEVARRAAQEGWTLGETLERAELSRDQGFATSGLPFVYRLDRDFALRRAWEEATGAVRAEEIPSS